MTDERVDERTAIENACVLRLVQAMLGAVTPNWRRVTLEVQGEALVRIRVWLDHEDLEDREELADLSYEFAALWDRPLDVKVEVSIDGGPLPVPLAVERWVYARKDGNPPNTSGTDRVLAAGRPERSMNAATRSRVVAPPLRSA